MEGGRGVPSPPPLLSGGHQLQETASKVFRKGGGREAEVLEWGGGGALSFSSFPPVDIHTIAAVEAFVAAPGGLRGVLHRGVAWLCRSLQRGGLQAAVLRGGLRGGLRCGGGRLLVALEAGGSSSHRLVCRLAGWLTNSSSSKIMLLLLIMTLVIIIMIVVAIMIVLYPPNTGMLKYILF